MRITTHLLHRHLIGLALVQGFIASQAATALCAETVGERFESYMTTWEKQCASMRLGAQETTCDILKLRPRNFSQTKLVKVDGQPEPVPEEWVSTTEGKLAHAIRIPNSLPSNSGYRHGISSEEYFDHLCKTEAGEFIFKTIPNEHGISMLRPRNVKPYESNHLYAMENPFISVDDARGMTIWRLVRPNRFEYVQTHESISFPTSLDLDTSIWAKPPSPATSMFFQYFGFDGRFTQTMKKRIVGRNETTYGYVWRGVVRRGDRDLGIAGGEIIVLNNKTLEVLAVKRGFARFEFLQKAMGLSRLQWMRRCPDEKLDIEDREIRFLLKVFNF